MKLVLVLLAFSALAFQAPEGKADRCDTGHNCDCLRSTVFRASSSSKPVTSERCFMSRVEQRQRITGETFEVAAQAIAKQLADYELQTLN
jgi:hypothetical protein